MNNTRINLHNLLVGLFPSINVYYNPLPNLSMTYPCVVYKLTDRPHQKANNVLYLDWETYQVTHSVESKSIINLDNSKFVRSFMVNSLMHEVYEVVVPSVQQ